ncbi:MAG: metallophosphoesterase [Alphaproteobacteria bacterium]
MHDGHSDDFRDTVMRRRAWRERREALEAKPAGRRWRGRVRGQLYSTARGAHDLLRPTRLFKWGAARALALDMTELELHLPDLPAAFDGYRILHLTDLHLDNIEDTAQATAARIADIESDLCVITGDIRDNIHAPLEPLIERFGHVLGAVRTRDGILGVLGNHDSAAMVSPMENLGMRVLVNETVSIARGPDIVHVTGLDDVHRFETEAAHAALDAAPDGFCIALVHSPEVADRAAAGHRLYLTGHTHGGQICLPSRKPLASSLRRHRDLARGVWRRGDMVGYTSRGIGACVVPFRSYCPGEVVIVTLRRGPERIRLSG